MARNLAILVGGGFVAWAVVYFPARQLGGEQAVVFSLAALLICLVPNIATLLWAQRSWQKYPERRLVIVVAGTGMRFAFVLGSALVLYSGWPYFQQTSFWLWIVSFYVLMLGLETTLVRGLSPRGSTW